MPTMKDFEGTWLPFDSADHRSFVIKHGFINDCNSVRVDGWHLEVRAGRDDQGTLFTERAALTQSGTQLRWTHGPIWARQGHQSDDMRSDRPPPRSHHGSQNSHRNRSRTADDRPVDSLKPPSPGQSLQPDVCQSPGCQFLMPSDEKKVCELHCCKKCRACPGEHGKLCQGIVRRSAPPASDPGTQPASLVPAATEPIVPPGTFRWIIQNDGQCELLVIDASLMPTELVRYAKVAVSTFVLAELKGVSKVDELIGWPDDTLAWTSGDWPAGSLDEYAAVARIPAGTFVDVWAAAQGGNTTTRPRAAAMALCIAAALFKPLLERATDVKTVLGHDEFSRLLDEARAELARARALWRQRMEAEA